MKYILIIIISLYFNTLSAQQLNTDSLFTLLLSSIENDKIQDSSRRPITEKEVKSLLDLYYQMQKYEKEYAPNYDLYNQFQILEDYSFTAPALKDTMPLTFATYYLKKLERLEAIRKIIIPQREAMLKYLREGHTPDPPAIAALRRYLGFAQSVTALIFLMRSLQ